MTRFTDSPYERMMTRRPEGGKETSRPPSLPHSHPCYGCGNYGSPCVGICHREMERWLKERKRKKLSVLIIFIKLIAVFRPAGDRRVFWRRHSFYHVKQNFGESQSKMTPLISP